MLRRFACVLLACLALGSTAFAQNTASLTGTITDESKGVMPGVTVTLTEQGSGQQYVTTSDERGEYRFPTVPPGAYRVQIELSGFSTITIPRVELLVGQAASMAFSMTVATRSESLTVTAQTSLITTGSAEVGGNIDRRQMAELPILGRNWMEMSLLVKGITSNTMAGNRAGAVRDDQFQLNVDGQQITQGISTSDTFGQPRISREAIAEYELSTSGYDVTQGRSVGIQVQAVSRSGTNAIHGSAYGNFRDDGLIAQDFIAQKVLPYSNTQAGFSVGGPIVQNKLHYFGTYEYEREPNSALFNPQVWANAPVKTLTFQTKTLQHTALARSDYQINNQDRLSLRWNVWNSNVPFGSTGGNAYPTAAAQSTRHNVSVIGDWTRVLSNNAVQEVKVGFTRYEFANRLGLGVPSTPVYSQSGLPNIGGTSFYPQAFYTQTPSFRYDLNMHAGSHDFKMGGEYLHRRDGADWPNNTRGTFTVEGQTAAEWARRFPLDAWNDSSKWDLSGMNVTKFNVGFANDFELKIPRHTYALWVADTWRPSGRLTLNYGVRYDLATWARKPCPG